MTKISLLFHPLFTLSLFIRYCLANFNLYIHPHILYLICLLCSLTLIYPNTITFILKWVILGIMSSVGIGSGFNTGVLFLTPHIIEISHTCDRDRITRDRITRDRDCDSQFWKSFFDLYPTVIYWGIGASIGELSTYLLARSTRLHTPHIDGLIPISDDTSVVKYFTLNYWKHNNKMEYLLKNYGFWIIMSLSLCPNIFFDIIGYLSGYYLVSIWTFISAVITGRALLRMPIQLYVTLLLTSSDYITTTYEGMTFILDFVSYLFFFIFIKDLIEMISTTQLEIEMKDK